LNFIVMGATNRCACRGLFGIALSIYMELSLWWAQINRQMGPGCVASWNLATSALWSSDESTRNGVSPARAIKNKQACIPAVDVSYPSMFNQDRTP
jgi:hypothetical protein